MDILNRLYKFEDMSNEDVLLTNGFQNVNQLIDYSNYLKDENERLNNIINELEKYIDNEIEILEKEISQATKEEDTFGYSCALGKYEIEQKLDVLYDVSIELSKLKRVKR